MTEGLANDINRLLRLFTDVLRVLNSDPAAMAEAKAMVLKAVAANPTLVKSIAAHPVGRQLAGDLLKRQKATTAPVYLNKIVDPRRGVIRWHD